MSTILEIPISSIRKRQDWMLWLTVLKKIKTAQPVPESLRITALEMTLFDFKVRFD
jgi:hypothetical protein